MVQCGICDRIHTAISVLQVDRELPLPGLERDIVISAIKVWSSILESDEGLDVLVSGPGTLFYSFLDLFIG
jgi:hypothetical protein